MVLSSQALQETFEIVVKFAEMEDLYHLLCDEDALEYWCLRWLANGWRDQDGRDMNQGVIYRQGGEKRLLPRWASMLLGLESGYRRKAGEE